MRRRSEVEGRSQDVQVLGGLGPDGAKPAAAGKLEEAVSRV